MIKVDNSSLECPDCRDIYLHQEEVRVIFRDAEDGPATQARTDTNSTTVTRLKDSDVPGRRDVIQIDFTCEICDARKSIKTLQIMQHKGCTLVEWILKD